MQSDSYQENCNLLIPTETASQPDIVTCGSEVTMPYRYGHFAMIHKTLTESELWPVLRDVLQLGYGQSPPFLEISIYRGNSSPQIPHYLCPHQQLQAQSLHLKLLLAASYSRLQESTQHHFINSPNELSTMAVIQITEPVVVDAKYCPKCCFPVPDKEARCERCGHPC